MNYILSVLAVKKRMQSLGCISLQFACSKSSLKQLAH